MSLQDNNLVLSYREYSLNKYGTVAEGVRKINTVCGTSLRPSHFIEMQKGQRKVDEKVQRFMLSQVLMQELEKAGYRVNCKTFEQLCDALTLPRRV